MVNINKIFNDVAAEQGIEPGSYDWLLGGTQAYSGTTGGHSSYGFKHDHKLASYGDAFAKWVISNYGFRRCFYIDPTGAIIPRRLDYLDAGRPLFYLPELPGDNADGSTTYQTLAGPITMSGPDIQHFQLGTLLAVFDHPKEILVLCQKQMVPAKMVVGQMIRYLMKSLAGMCMKTPTQLNTYFFNDRGAACIMNATQHAFKRNLIDPEDLHVLRTYIETVILPRYEGPQPYAESDKPTAGVMPPVTGNKLAALQLYNGLYWTLPIMYDIWKLLPPSALKTRYAKIITRHSQYIEDLEVLMPGQGVAIAVVSFPPSVMAGINGEAVPNWQALTVENCHFTGDIVTGKKDDWSLWGYRAQRVAAKWLNSSILLNSSKLLLEKLKSNVLDPEMKGWLVDADCNYVEPLAGPIGGKTP